MQLTRFRVRKFRNIVDSDDIVVDPHVTCLVGMNEAGKTAILTALHLLNPVSDQTFSVQRDYPRWLKAKDQRSGELANVRPIVADFTLTDDELAEVDARFGAGALASKTITLSRAYDDGNLYYVVQAEESAVVRALVERLQLSNQVTKASKKADTFDSLRSALDGVDSEDETVVAEVARFRDEITALVGDGTAAKAIWKHLSALVPSFFYFGEYNLLEGRIDLVKLAGDEETASSPDQTARALLALADTTPDALSGDDYEDRKAELESVSNELTDQVFEYWKQNPHLRVRFDIDRTIGMNVQGNPVVTQNCLDIRVEDTRHHFTNNFSQRSSGFRWFFSFLAAFSEFEQRADSLVVLLDEPGLTLHGRAQADFLRFIDERLAPAAPVIYTTHSPFMVKTDQLERVRIVEDKGPEDGAVVSQEVLNVGASSLFPLQAALGYDIAQHLFIGGVNLLVEGPSDFLYLDLIGRHLASQDRPALDEHLRILTAGGSSNIPAFVALIGRELEVSILIDSGTEGAGKLDAALEAGHISKGRLVRVGDVTASKHADIEDLFAIDDYLSLYNKAFGKRVKATNLGNGDRIIYRLEQLHGKFDHYKPAEALLRNPALLDELSAETLENFEKLIQRINATLQTQTPIPPS
ncbi:MULTISPECIES: AAA family ATPase [unclassified Gordonia (in: high G+C Gram-positive bacteria)]|uniref:ATP-dependent nuclease n=1 Tax=unclassified Gordonia (in: high G+C Gram-positive bacteria) TaxID=2657482 RepID=UPI0010F4543E|nr:MULTISPECIES: AAA family ATPase [unclassified Gordonia (in: high G+C Gram-positive bacteria)]